MEKCEVIRNMTWKNGYWEEDSYGTVPKTPNYCWGAIADNPINPWELEDEKKSVTNDQLVAKMENIKTLIVILLRSKGL